MVRISFYRVKEEAADAACVSPVARSPRTATKAASGPTPDRLFSGAGVPQSLRAVRSAILD